MNDWHPAFYQTLPVYLEVYKSLCFKVLQIGEEAIASLITSNPELNSDSF
ncbi:MAG: hypothetical protein WA919_13475 [Coleofasciculaceae cyanobacterium]